MKYILVVWAEHIQIRNVTIYINKPRLIIFWDSASIFFQLILSCFSALILIKLLNGVFFFSQKALLFKILLIYLANI